ncbi:hypothetical protein FZH34_12270 [Salmonella enterica]|nr:hypothetical protein [Salmonella enterica]EDK5690766.1 hypothetical protein [Salmonella enterica subsp. enterica serovar Litchfield]EGA0724892.1 hypothetical protein [Salmonella enterica subsp. enterica serovar Newport]EKO1083441.1 hypothetical protein [Salmonella enterica subsp. enterica]EBC9300936.1 hypothetical protein [Salmonella enterica]
MSTITRERLLKIQQWRETYGAGSNVMLPAEEAEELARIALAALEAAPEPVVPESISVRQAISALESADCVTTIGQAYKMGWNACRAAMLQSKYRDLSQPVDPQISEYEKIMLQAGNSPVIPDGYALVPVEPTRQMMAQGHFAMKGTDRGKFRRIYQAMITAAPALNKGGINAE